MPAKDWMEIQASMAEMLAARFRQEKWPRCAKLWQKQRRNWIEEKVSAGMRCAGILACDDVSDHLRAAQPSGRGKEEGQPRISRTSQMGEEKGGGFPVHLGRAETLLIFFDL